jgi:signal transduction histidine kinase
MYAAAGMTTFEISKQIAFPHLTMWMSNLLTTVAGGMAAIIAAYFAFGGQVELLEQAAAEAVGRKRAEAELQKAKESAKAAGLAKNQFAASMSHEMRTSVNRILGMAELALVTELTAEQHDCIETVKTSAESLLTVFEDILDFSKIEEGNLDLDQTEFNLRECVEDSLKTLALRAHQIRRRAPRVTSQPRVPSRQHRDWKEWAAGCAT